TSLASSIRAYVPVLMVMVSLMMCLSAGLENQIASFDVVIVAIVPLRFEERFHPHVDKLSLEVEVRLNKLDCHTKPLVGFHAMMAVNQQPGDPELGKLCALQCRNLGGEGFASLDTSHVALDNLLLQRPLAADNHRSFPFSCAGGCLPGSSIYQNQDIVN